MKLVQTPDGRRLSLDQLTSYQLAGNQLRLDLGTTQAVLDAGGPATAAAWLAALDAFVVGTEPVLTLNQTPRLTSFSPNPVALPVWPALTPADTLIIYGENFDPAKLGLIHLEDVGGGLDSNGLVFTPTWVDRNLLTATFSDWGDQGPPTLLYYEDSTGYQTNTLACTVV